MPPKTKTNKPNKTEEVINNEKDNIKDEIIEDVESEESDMEDKSDNDENKSKKKPIDNEELKMKKEELKNRKEDLKGKMKSTDKEIQAIEKTLDDKRKERKEIEKEIFHIDKSLDKCHQDELNKKEKDKKKRGNGNGGFNKKLPVPEKLGNFLGKMKFADKDDPNIIIEYDFKNEECSRPIVMKALNKKFTDMGLKEGQNTKLNTEVVKILGLGKEYENKEVKFTEFQSFLASFYPKKSKVQKNTVELDI